MKKRQQVGSNFDDFLREENLLDAAEATAVKRVIAFQIAQEMKLPNDDQVRDGESDEDRSCGDPLKSNKLSPSMSVTQFENGYWYATELKDFAETIGISSANKLRKDELEKAIKHFLKTGKIESPTKRNLSNSGIKDVERGLTLNLRVVVYTNDKETKSFIEREAQKLAPGLKRKSGARYRHNRWREEQLTNGIKLTYRDVVNEYVRLCQTEQPFTKLPHGRYINFMSDFLASERSATREQAIEAWKQLKKLDAPKTYRSWVKSQSSKQR